MAPCSFFLSLISFPFGAKLVVVAAGGGDCLSRSSILSLVVAGVGSVMIRPGVPIPVPETEVVGSTDRAAAAAAIAEADADAAIVDCGAGGGGGEDGEVIVLVVAIIATGGGGVITPAPAPGPTPPNTNEPGEDIPVGIYFPPPIFLPSTIPTATNALTTISTMYKHGIRAVAAVSIRRLAVLALFPVVGLNSIAPNVSSFVSPFVIVTEEPGVDAAPAPAPAADDTLEDETTPPLPVVVVAIEDVDVEMRILPLAPGTSNPHPPSASITKR